MTTVDHTSLRGIPLFASLHDSDREAIATRMEFRSLPRNSLMICEGEKSDSLFVILDGKVKIFLLDDSGSEVILNYLHQGDYFGEISLFDDGHRSASVQTLDRCSFGVLKKDNLIDLMARHPELAVTIVRGTTRRLKDLSNSIRSLAANW